jgi:O-antigen ligase
VRVRADAAGRYLALATLYALALAGFPFVSILPLLLGVPARPISIAFRALVLLLSLFVAARRLLGDRAMLRGLPLASFAVLWACLSLRLMWDATLVPLPLHIEWDDYFAFAFGVALLPTIALLELPERGTLRIALWITHVVGSVALIGIAVIAVRGLLSGRLLTRLATDVLNPASVGYHAATVFATAVATRAALAGRTGPGPVVYRGLQLVMMALAITVTVATGSRGPVACLLLLMIITTLVPIDGRASGTRLTFRCIGLFVIVGFVVSGAMAVEEISSLSAATRVTDVLEDESTSERVVMLRGAWDQFASHPWLGDSVVERTTRSYPHNMFLEAGMSIGVVGLTCMAAFATTALAAAVRSFRAGWHFAWLTLVYLIHLVASVVSGSIIFSYPFWAAAIAVLVADCVRRPVDAALLLQPKRDCSNSDGGQDTTYLRQRSSSG